MGIKTEAEFPPLARVIIKRLYLQWIGSCMDSVGFCDTVLCGGFGCFHAAVSVLIA